MIISTQVFRGLLLAALWATGCAEARLIRVGPGGDVNKISDAARIARDGDLVEITAGEWHADVALWSQKQLTIRGVGGRPVLHAAGQSVEGKAIWVIRNGDFVIENIEFRGARVPDGNGAGIRFEGGRLLIRNSAFYDNQMGILTSSNAQAELLIEDCIFSDAPQQSKPLPHLLYAGPIALLKVTGSRFHAGYFGHLIKSRAKETDLRYNFIFDGPNGRASYEIDLPVGGVATILGNVIGQSDRTENPTLIAYAAEGARWEKNRLNVINNTLISIGNKPAWFIRVWRRSLPHDFKSHIANNLWSGFGLFNYGVSGTSEGNWWVFNSNFDGRDFLDYRLAPESWLRDRVKPQYIGEMDLTPVMEFVFPVGTRALSSFNSLTPGAFQW